MKEEVISRLKDIIAWSDRLGSDEIIEIRELIKLLEDDTIELKFKPGDKAFIMSNNAVHEVIVAKCAIEVSQKMFDVDNELVIKDSYELKDHPINSAYSKSFNGHALFKTKEELLNTL